MGELVINEISKVNSCLWYEREMGIKFVNTYRTVLGFGDCDCETWWEVPNLEAIDKMRGAMSVVEQHYKQISKLI